jgi:hypothetical protein
MFERNAGDSIKDDFTRYCTYIVLFSYAREKSFSCFGKGHTWPRVHSHSFSIIFTNGKFRFEIEQRQYRCSMYVYMEHTLVQAADYIIYIQTDFQMFILVFCKLLIIIYYHIIINITTICRGFVKYSTAPTSIEFYFLSFIISTLFYFLLSGRLCPTWKWHQWRA